MKLPRFRIVWLMFLVAIVGFNFWAIRMILRDYGGPTADMVGVGALLMANILMIAPLVGYSRRISRSFLWGFEVFGATATVLYVALTILLSARVPYLAYYTFFAEQHLIGDWEAPWSSSPPWIKPGKLLAYILFAVWLTLPQLIFALLGGCLTRYLRLRAWPV